MDRRSFLHTGILGSFGASLAMADQKHYDSKEGAAKSVIFIYLPGGMAHQETFDPKPFAPLEYRGPPGSIDTASVPLGGSSERLGGGCAWGRTGRPEH